MKYLKCAGISAREAMEYRMNYLIGIISYIMPMVLQCFLWTAIYTDGNKPSMHGYSYYEMISYTLLSGMVSRMVAAGFQYEMANDIKTGAMNKFLVQPVSYFFYRIFCFIGQKCQHFSIMIIFISGILVFQKTVLNMEFGMTEVFCFLTALILGTTMNFLIFYCLSMSAFWFFEATSFFGTFALISRISGGELVPVEFFGSTINNIFSFLPFKYTIFFPVSIINGRIDGGEITLGMTVQLVWIIFFIILSGVLWRRGIKKYVAVGG